MNQIVISCWVVECFLPGRLRSTNSFSERHWRERYRERRDWEWQIRAALGKAVLFRQPVKITITRVLGKGERLYDAGNLEAGSSKQLVDALVRLGWLVDDSPKHLAELVCLQDPDHRDKPGTRLRIEELTWNLATLSGSPSR